MRQLKNSFFRIVAGYLPIPWTHLKSADHDTDESDEETAVPAAISAGAASGLDSTRENSRTAVSGDALGHESERVGGNCWWRKAEIEAENAEIRLNYFKRYGRR